MTDPQAEPTQTEEIRREDPPERLPWVTPRLDSIKFQDAQAGLNTVPDASGSAS
jgi:hypothetical protein